METHSDDGSFGPAFCDEHGIAHDRLLAPFERLVVAVFRSRNAVLADLARTSTNHWALGLIVRMSERATEHAASVVAAWATGFPAQAEVLSRATFEHAVAMLYIMGADSEERVGSYFRNFLAGEETLLDRLTKLNTTTPIPGLDQRRQGFDARREFVERLEGELGLDRSRIPKWPSIFDRCHALGLEREYRLFYTQLSAQGHADPEDLLNEMMIAAHAPHLHEKAAVETVHFSWAMTLAGIDMFLRATARASAWLGSGLATEVADGERRAIVQLTLVPAAAGSGA